MAVQVKDAYKYGQPLSHRGVEMMKTRGTWKHVAASLPLLFALRHASAAEPGFDERVRAQMALDRVYYSHQIDATVPVAEAVTRDVAVRKVRRYLRQSRALETRWHTGITPDMLQRELQRMAAGTRLPDRLLELYRALDDNPLLIQECLARPALVDRLSRNFYASDTTLHAAARAEARRLRSALGTGRLDRRLALLERTVTDVIRIEPGTHLSARRDTPGGNAAAPALELSPEEFAAYRAQLPFRVGDVGRVEELSTAFVVRIVVDESPGRLRVASTVVPKRSFDQWLVEAGPGLDRSVTTSDTGKSPRPSLPAPSAKRGRPDPCFVEDAWNNGSLDDVPAGRYKASSVWTGS